MFCSDGEVPMFERYHANFAGEAGVWSKSSMARGRRPKIDATMICARSCPQECGSEKSGVSGHVRRSRPPRLAPNRSRLPYACSGAGVFNQCGLGTFRLTKCKPNSFSPRRTTLHLRPTLPSWVIYNVNTSGSSMESSQTSLAPEFETLQRWPLFGTWPGPASIQHG
jgi:hypothetical protein